MMRTFRLAALSVTLSLVTIPALCAEVQVKVDPATKYQTIRGWGAAFGWMWQKMPPEVREQVIAEEVDVLGLNRLRFEPGGGGGRRWEKFNDDGDPEHMNLAALDTATADRKAAELYLPFKRRVEARGEPFSLYVSPSFFDGGSSGAAPAWLLHSPGEYAEFATSVLLYLKEKHGLTAEHYCICNEAGNNNDFSPAAVGQMIKTLGPRLQALGLPTRIQFPECVSGEASWRYIQQLQNDPAIWPHIAMVSYHLYGKNDQRSSIRDFALAKGLPTGQTEFMGLTINHLYDDLTQGGVSYWEFYAQNDYLRFNANRTAFFHQPGFWSMGQVTRYVRPGAARVAATTDDATVRALAFERGGKLTVVLLGPPQGAAPADVALHGLPPGEYGLSRTTGRKYEELGVKTVAAGEGLAATLPPTAVMTLYPRLAKDLPPVISDWRAAPTFLAAPAIAARLSASACDPELAPLSFAWAIKSQPAGAEAKLQTPDAADCQAAGLTVAGDYVFTLSVKDGAHTVTRDLRLTRYDANQPPDIVDLHNRIPVTVTLPTRSTTLRGGGYDIEGDPLTYQWTVVHAPAGTEVALESPTKGSCLASGMTVAGDYVFRFEASDPTHKVGQELTVTVYPENTAPAIAAMSAAPAQLLPPADSTTLSAQTSDPDKDVISHWWSLRSAPGGAAPAPATPGAPTTKVSGLTVEGRYVFTLTVVDRTKFTARDVTVTVGQPRPAPVAPAPPPTPPAVPKAPTSAPTPLPPSADPPTPTSRDDRTISARGTTVGAVAAKGRAWVEVTSAAGKTARYIPEWRGGMPSAGGGPDAQVVAQIAAVKVGDRVIVAWHVNDHIRADEVKPAP